MGTETNYHRRRIGRFALVGAGATAGAAAIAIGGLRPFRAIVRGDSMEPTLREGDVVLVFARITPRTGDVVHILPDGSRLPDPVPLREGEWFVIGDALEGSTDSRAFGPVTRKSIRGVVRLVLSPRDRAGRVKPRR